MSSYSSAGLALAIGRLPETPALRGEIGRFNTRGGRPWQRLESSSWPGLSRPSTFALLSQNKTWMPGTRPGMTKGGLPRPIKPHRIIDQQGLLQRRRGRDLRDHVGEHAVVRRFALHVRVRPVGAPQHAVGKAFDDRA